MIEENLGGDDGNGGQPPDSDWFLPSALQDMYPDGPDSSNSHDSGGNWPGPPEPPNPPPSFDHSSIAPDMSASQVLAPPSGPAPGPPPVPGQIPIHVPVHPMDQGDTSMSSESGVLAPSASSGPPPPPAAPAAAAPDA